MATLSHAESRRLYSWWWDSHISPKNSKWLQENLTDMDTKVKAMIKLIEEDADSFARRAEMYYKKRPELMKLVEEFYRAYRALAERYDHATGALRQAHRTIAEAFPNQVPLALNDDSPSGSSMAESEPHTPEIPHSIRALFDPDDLQKDTLGVPLHFQATKRNGAHIEDVDGVTGKKGLKQLNGIFSSGNGTDSANFAEGRVRKGLKFQEQGKKGSECTLQDVSRDIQKYNKEETDTDRKLRDLLDEFYQLSTENQNLKVKVLSESERAEKAEKIVESLQQSLSKLKSEKEAAFLLYQQCLERVSSLEAEISRGQADISRLNGEILEGTSRLQAAEERFLLSEKENQSLQSEVDILVQKTTVQQRELEKKNEELEKLRICIQDGRIHLMRAEAALQSLKSLHSHLLEEQRILQLELKHGIQMLKDMEFMKQCLENEIWRLKEENLVLNERHKSSTMSINNLQDEIYSLKEVKVKLEEEVGLHVDQGDALRQELYCLREKLHDLDRRHQDVTEQVEAVGLNVNCLQSSVKDLQEENLKLKQSCEDIEYEKAILSSSAKNFQYENLKLKEICETKEHDKEILSEKLENMEKLLVKNELLENSLSDASAELEGLRGKIKMLEESFDLHLREKSTLATEKGFLVSQIESITKNIEKLLEKNSVLENSLSGANVELEGMRAKSTGLEASCQALQDEKSSLLFVIDSMVSQVETIKKCLENLERRHAELENKHSCLEKERESALHNIDKLQLSLNLREQEHETYIQSSQIQLATLGSQIHVLQEEAQSRKIEFEEEQGKLINSEVEIFVLQRSIYDIKERSSMLEDTLTDVNVELEGLRLKSKSLEESCQVLQDEKLILLLEIDNLVSQVESIKQCLENMEKRHADLEDRHSCLEKEKESALHNIDELQLSLNLQKEERETYVQSSQAQLATLGSHIHVLQEEAQLRKRQFEEEQDKFMNSDVEIFVLQRYICDMRERNSMLENSLSDVNIEVEGLREKCKSLEESCQFLQDEELSHLLEIENMVCQVESVEQCLENSEERHAELEDKHMHLEKERESALHHIDELQLELSTRKKEQETYLQSSQAQLATLENQIYLLQEEAELRKRQFEEVQDKFMYAEFEIVVLQRCIHDMKESNLLLSIECKEQIEASMHAKKLILELEEENLGQQMKVKSLLENNEKLRTGIHHVLKSLGIVADDGCCDITIREFFPLILGKIKDMQCSVLDTEDEKQQLLFEKIVSDTLLKQLQLDASDLKSDKHALEQESVIRSNELLMLQREKHELLETNKQLKHGVHEGQRRVGILMGDVEILQGKLSDSQEAYQKLQDENYKLREENQSLKKEIYDLKEEQYMVEEENRNLSLIFKSICSEKAMEIETLGNELDHLHGVDNELEQVRIVVKKAEAENLRLKESIAELKKFKTDSMILEDELNMERNVSEQLNREVENGKELLNKKEKELSEAIQKLKGIQNEGAELHKEFSELKFTKEQLDSELQEKTSMVEQSEMEAAAFYEDLQTNAIFLALFKEKAFELVSSCRSLEEYSIIQNEMFSGERDSRNAANKELKIKLGVLERENGALKDELTAYLPLTLSLKDSISSLEELTLTLTKLHANYPETQDAAAVSSHHDVTHQELGEADDAKALAGVTELQKLQTWVQAMEKAMMEMGRLTMQASSNTNARLEAAMKEIEELKSKNSLLQNEVVQNKKGVILQQGDEEEPSKNVEAQNNEAEASRAKRELVMKDIQLDHVSDPLSHENGVDSCRICKKGKSETDDQMLELWETAEQDTRRKRSTKRRTKKPTSTTSFDSVEYRLIKVVEKQKNEYSSSELQSEKELSVDKSEVPERIFVPQDDGNKRILERLASDAQRLTNLQINAQELKRKFEKSEKANQLLGFEYESVKVQLKEVVEAILQLIDVNSKLTKNVEDGSASSGSKGKLEEMGNMRMRQVSERARRWSEQIGRLELEVQRIQFVMVKLENEYGNKGTKAFNRQTGVVLRDYIYGGKGRRRWKKSHCCCACMRPSTKCD